MAEEAEQKRRAEERKQAEEIKRKQAEEKERKRREEEAERRQAEEAERKRQAEEARRLAEEAEQKRRAEERKAARDEEIKRQEQQALLRTQAIRELSRLHDLIAEHIEDNWRRPSQDIQGLQATIKVKVSINGKVLLVEVVNSSGDLKFDRSAEVAIKKASPLPFPTNPKYYDYIKEFELVFKPDG